MSTYSRYRQRIGDTVNNGVAWKTPSCICSCQWCIKSEVFCGNCWMLRRRLEAVTSCRRGPQSDGKCSFYLNCYFFHTSPTNQDLSEKAVYFPPWTCSMINVNNSSCDLFLNKLQELGVLQLSVTVQLPRSNSSVGDLVLNSILTGVSSNSVLGRPFPNRIQDIDLHKITFAALSQISAAISSHTVSNCRSLI